MFGGCTMLRRPRWVYLQAGRPARTGIFESRLRRGQGRRRGRGPQWITSSIERPRNVRGRAAKRLLSKNSLDVDRYPSVIRVACRLLALFALFCPCRLLLARISYNPASLILLSCPARPHSDTFSPRSGPFHRLYLKFFPAYSFFLTHLSLLPSRPQKSRDTVVLATNAASSPVFAVLLRHIAEDIISPPIRCPILKLMQSY